MSLNNKVANPRHVAVIMDGNGRWAKARGLKRSEGHEAGMQAIKTICRAMKKYDGVKVLTLFAFSTENWKRPQMEVNYLMNMPGRFFDEFMPEIQENNIRINLTGFPNQIPKKTRQVIEQAARDTQDNDGFILNLAFNYGGRQEIVYACQQVAKEVAEGHLQLRDIDEEVFEQYLLNTSATAPYQDIDLLIRTSGEIRLSNFLLWQNAYSEFYFTDKYWPDFDEDELKAAMTAYHHRQRRYGAI